MPTILLVEDNQDDLDLTRETFRRTNRSIDIHHVSDGKECMEFLRKSGKFSSAPTPDLVLLDLNMPGMDGRDVLNAVSADSNLKHLPIVVLSTSNAQTDVMVSYQLGCRSFLTKPVDIIRFQQMVSELCVFWFDTAELPPAL